MPLIALLASLCLQAQTPPQKRAMTVDDVFALKQVSDPQISPDGKSVVYVVSVVDAGRNRRDTDLWLVKADGEGAAPRQITFNAGRDFSPRWSPDGKRIAFLRTRPESGENSPQIWLMDFPGGEARRLTNESGIGSLEWSQDGSALYFLAEEPRAIPGSGPNQMVTQSRIMPIVEDENRPRTQLVRLELPGGAKAQVTRGAFSVSEFSLSPDETAVVFEAAPTSYFNDSPKSEIYLLSLNAKDAQPRQLTKNAWSERGFAWRPDGSGFIFLAGADQEFKSRSLQEDLFFYSLKEGRVEAQSLGSAARSSTGYPGPVTQAEWFDPNTLLLVVAHGTNQDVRLYDYPSQSLFPVTRGGGVSSSVSLSRSGDRIAFLRETPERAADVWVSDIPPFQEPRAVTGHNLFVRELALATFEVVRWKASDGVEVEGILYTPEGKGPWPLVTNIHGGPASAQMAGFYASHGSYPHVLAGQGVATLYPNYRGSTNYGTAFVMRSVGDRNGRDALDIEEGIDAMVQRGVADPKRLAVMGWSAGGVLTNWLVTRSARFRAAISGAGTSAWIFQYFLSDYTFGSDTYFNGTPWEKDELYWERSPLRLAPRVKTPVLIHAGTNDERVPIAHSRAWFRALRANGVTTRMVSYPGEPHGLQLPSSQRRKLEEDLAWLSKYLLAP